MEHIQAEISKIQHDQMKPIKQLSMVYVKSTNVPPAAYVMRKNLKH